MKVHILTHISSVLVLHSAVVWRSDRTKVFITSWECLIRLCKELGVVVQGKTRH